MTKNTNRHCEGMTRVSARGNLNRLLSIILAAVLLFSAFTILPLTASAADVDTAETDTREPILVIRATSANFAEPVIGAPIQKPTFKITEGSPAYISPVGSTGWDKKIDGHFTSVDSGVFSEGEWRFGVQARIEDPNYVLTKETKLYVNDVLWTIGDGPVMDGGTFCFVYFVSPAYTLEGETELQFNNSYNQSIISPQADRAITPFSVAPGVSGGKKPYTFSKVSKSGVPAWINVSADGTVSGTPDQGYKATVLWVQVTDSAGATAEIAITVPAVKADPAKRTPVDTITATSNIAAWLVNGKPFGYPKISGNTGDGLTDFPSSMMQWQKLVDGEWTIVDSGKFTPGEWKLTAQVRVENPNYVMTDSTKVMIDGAEWQKGQGKTQVHDTVSFNYYSSPVFTVDPPCIVTFSHPDGGFGAMTPAEVNKGDYYTLPECTFIPPVGATFKGWLFDGTLYQPDDKILINGDTELIAEWYNACKITFDSNGGSGSMKSVTVEKGSTYTLPECTFSPPANKVFDKWAVNGMVSFGNVTQITVNEDTVLTARWKDAPTGNYTISGSVTSFLDAENGTSISLSMKSGDTYTIKEQRTVVGNSAAYSFTGLARGQYKLTLTKKNHVPREYNVTLLFNDKTQDLTICPVGDVSGDGKVTTKDYAMANAHAQKVSLLTDYALKCGDVLKNDGKITTADAARINAAAQKVDPLW